SDLLQRYEQVKDKNLKPEMRRIIPLFVKDRKLADDLLQQIRSGADITDLAAKYSENKMGLNKTDPGVYIKKDYWGEVGKEAFNLKVGQNSNVIVTNDTGFAIIKLVAIQGAAPYKYEEVRSQIEEVMKSETLQQQLNGLLQKTAKNYKVKIYRDAVKKVEYMGGNMGIKKTHFPLRNFVPTMPLFDHNAKWYKEIVSKN
ncbi:MAG: peptidylprolyl isomerase, partial [Bacteroidota bacterium]|nr:peptidylprolyl isomerase [Bacteroidota bacterium]